VKRRMREERAKMEAIERDNRPGRRRLKDHLRRLEAARSQPLPDTWEEGPN
jgi:hypothetical protein